MGSIRDGAVWVGDERLWLSEADRTAMLELASARTALLPVGAGGTILLGGTSVDIGWSLAGRWVRVGVTINDDGTGVATLAGFGVRLDHAQVLTLSQQAWADRHPV